MKKSVNLFMFSLINQWGTTNSFDMLRVNFHGCNYCVIFQVMLFGLGFGIKYTKNRQSP